MFSKYFFTLLLTSICLSKNILAQQKLPDIVKPSPQSTNFQKFGEFPVSYNTGIPDISIPLYTITSGDLEMPVTLRYHSSGIKVNDPDMSNIGTGWVLDVGGMVSRTIRGRADELQKRPTPFLSAFAIDQTTSTGISYLEKILTLKNVDVEYDKFTYSALGLSGNFSIDNDGNGNYTAYSYPFMPYKFDIQTGAPTETRYYKSITGINITDDKGTLYKFGHRNIEKASVADDYAPTTWFLEDVYNHARTNHIQISYDDVPEFYNEVKSAYLSITDNDFSINRELCKNGQPIDGRNSSCGTSSQLITYNTKCINTITFKNGYIKFNFNSAKQFIENIIIYNNNNEILKKISFKRDKFPGSNKFNRLNALEIQDKNNITSEKYQFSYNNINGSNGLPLEDGNCKLDYWGYCRGEGQGAECMRRTISVIDPESATGPPMGGAHETQIGNADISPDELYSKRFILTKIQYPTGGTTDFVYEGNKYIAYIQANPSIFEGGGLRIKKIISSDLSNNTITKTYAYEPGFVEVSLINYTFSTRTSFDISVHCFQGFGLQLPIYYRTRTRSFSNGWNKDLGDNRIYYKVVTEYTGDETNNTGKTIYRYKYENPDDITGILDLTAGIKNYKGWGNGLLYKKEVFKKTLNNYAKIKETTNQYEFKYIKTLENLKAQMISGFNGNSNTTPYLYNMTRTDLANSGRFSYWSFPNPCSIYDYNITTGAFYLKSSIEKDYFNSDSTTTITEYKHDNPLNYYVTEIKRNNSDLSANITRLKYPQDMTDPVSILMASKNIISPTVETKIFNSSDSEKLLSTTQNKFKQFGDFFGINEVLESFNDKTPFSVIKINRYDIYGNILEQQRTNGIIEVYLWGYNSAYPVAKILGSDYNTVRQYINQNLIDNINTTDNAMRTELDKLRQNLIQAHVQTYTFNPLIGMTSSTDPKGQTSYYSYDSFLRLKTIKDQNNHILKSFEYNYRQ